MKEKKNGGCHEGIRTRIPSSSSEISAASSHWAMRLLKAYPLKINKRDVSFSAIHSV